MLNDSEARLDFIQNMEYKFVELMYCSCIRSNDEVVQQHITYRYNSMKHKLSTMQSRLQEIHNLVKVKNPSLLLQLQKASGVLAPQTHMSGSYNMPGMNATALSGTTMAITTSSSSGSSGGGVSGVFQKGFR
jgi:ABC-type transport system involved in Fe-S cluster assembly fused permease/ATPase subunit